MQNKRSKNTSVKGVWNETLEILAAVAITIAGLVVVFAGIFAMLVVVAAVVSQ